MIDESHLRTFPPARQAEIRAEIDRLAGKGYAPEFLDLDPHHGHVIYNQFAHEKAVELCHAAGGRILALMKRPDGVTLDELKRALDLDTRQIRGIIAVLKQQAPGQGHQIVLSERTRPGGNDAMFVHEVFWRCV